jgi:hypothetical protein
MRTLILIALAVVTPLDAAELRAGVAKVDLDPLVGIPMAGYGAARFAKGTLDPLEARVLALSDGSRTIAFITLDLCFPFDPPVMELIRQQARGAVDEVIFHASHTHSGPTYSEVPEAAQHASRLVVGAIQAAARSLVPVQCGCCGATSRRCLRPFRLTRRSASFALIAGMARPWPFW